MEGEHGQKAKEKRRKFFARQKKGLDTYEMSFHSDITGFSMVSDSESSDSESEDLSTKKQRYRKGNAEEMSPPVRDIFSQASRKSFFKNDSKIRAKQWEIIISHWDAEDEETRDLVHQRINELIVSGIPSDLRPKLWCLFASSYDLKRKSEGIYEICLNSRHDHFDEDIMSDVRRTLPDHPMLSSGEGQKRLFEILRSYSSFNPSVGYVQCMNFIAGYMYTQLKSPELTFWTFVSLMQSIKGLFAEGLPLLNTSLDIFSNIIRKHLPVLFAHLAKQKFNISPIVSRWCSTLFCCPDFTFKFSIHTLDMYLYKGYESIFRIGTVLLSEAQGSLLKLEGEEIQTYLQQPPASLSNPSIILPKANKIKFDYEIERQIHDTT